MIFDHIFYLLLGADDNTTGGETFVSYCAFWGYEDTWCDTQSDGSGGGGWSNWSW